MPFGIYKFLKNRITEGSDFFFVGVIEIKLKLVQWNCMLLCMYRTAWWSVYVVYFVAGEMHAVFY